MKGQAASLEDSLERHRQPLNAIRLGPPDAAREATGRVLERIAADLGREPRGRKVSRPAALSS